MPKRVLVVEDEPDVATLVQMLLGAAGYSAQSAGDLLTARAVLGAPTPPHVVILDRVVFPDGGGLDGFDLCREIKARLPWVPVIVLTSWVSAATRAGARAVGADHFLTKPFEPDRLEYVVRLAAGDVPERRGRACPLPPAIGRRWRD